MWDFLVYFGPHAIFQGSGEEKEKEGKGGGMGEGKEGKGKKGQGGEMIGGERREEKRSIDFGVDGKEQIHEKTPNHH